MYYIHLTYRDNPNIVMYVKVNRFFYFWITGYVLTSDRNLASCFLSYYEAENFLIKHHSVLNFIYDCNIYVETKD